MHGYQIALLAGAIIASALSLHHDDRRYILWLAMGGVSFAVSTWLWRTFGTDHVWPAFFAGLSDATCAAVIVATRRTPIARAVAWLFLLMLCLNLAYLWRMIGPQSAYVFSLEIVNWLIIAVIGGKGLLRWVSYGLSSWGHPVGGFDGAIRAADAHCEAAGFIYRKK